MRIYHKWRRKKKSAMNIGFVIALFVFIASSMNVTASENTVLPTLIQSTTEEEDVQALLNLNMFYANVADKGDTRLSKELVIPCSVGIETGIYVGSGVILQINEQGVYIISSKHVLKNEDVAEITFYDEFKTKGNIIAVSGQYDMAIIQVPLENIDTFSLKKLRQVNIDVAAYENMKNGDSMFTLGSTDGVAQNFYRGTIEDTWEFVEQFNTYMLHSNCYAKAGMSGGGTFDAYGNYIGIITGGLDDESVSVPLPTIIEQYEELTGNELLYK